MHVWPSLYPQPNVTKSSWSCPGQLKLGGAVLVAEPLDPVQQLPNPVGWRHNLFLDHLLESLLFLCLVECSRDPASTSCMSTSTWSPVYATSSTACVVWDLSSNPVRGRVDQVEEGGEIGTRLGNA